MNSGEDIRERHYAMYAHWVSKMWTRRLMKFTSKSVLYKVNGKTDIRTQSSRRPQVPKVHHVVQGECLASIAKEHGYADWRHIYDDSCNEKLRGHRPKPHILLEGTRSTFRISEPRPPRCRGFRSRCGGLEGTEADVLSSPRRGSRRSANGGPQVLAHAAG